MIINNQIKSVDSRPLMVSISCTAYNHEHYIRQCLEGFVMQKTNFRFEAIVHDDASTDGTAAIIREYADKYPDIIKPIFETENQYSKHDNSLSRIMYEACTGKYIALCEGDDFWTDPHKLQMQVDYLENHKDCSISFNFVNVVDSNGTSLDRFLPPSGVTIENEIITLSDLIDFEFRKGVWALHTSSMVFRREMLTVFRKLWPILFSKIHCGDLPLQLTCLMHGNGYIIQKTLGCYRANVGVYSQKRSHSESIMMQLEIIDSFLKFNTYTYQKYSVPIHMRINRIYSAISCDLKYEKSFFNKDIFHTIMNCEHKWVLCSHYLWLRYIYRYILKLKQS